MLLCPELLIQRVHGAHAKHHKHCVISTNAVLKPWNGPQTQELPKPLLLRESSQFLLQFSHNWQNLLPGHFKQLSKKRHGWEKNQLFSLSCFLYKNLGVPTPLLSHKSLFVIIIQQMASTNCFCLRFQVHNSLFSLQPVPYQRLLKIL